mmetsp:Transcript_66438/g.197731  ORF Transcript_66438/g.197731 Transcript_66438/m.197731 type:complete len:398 (-) Transcript_66438:99-1292(-)
MQGPGNLADAEASPAGSRTARRGAVAEPRPATEPLGAREPDEPEAGRRRGLGPREADREQQLGDLAVADVPPAELGEERPVSNDDDPALRPAEEPVPEGRHAPLAPVPVAPAGEAPLLLQLVKPLPRLHKGETLGECRLGPPLVAGPAPALTVQPREDHAAGRPLPKGRHRRLHGAGHGRHDQQVCVKSGHGGMAPESSRLLQPALRQLGVGQRGVARLVVEALAVTNQQHGLRQRQRGWVCSAAQPLRRRVAGAVFLGPVARGRSCRRVVLQEEPPLLPRRLRVLLAERHVRTAAPHAGVEKARRVRLRTHQTAQGIRAPARLQQLPVGAPGATAFRIVSSIHLGQAHLVPGSGRQEVGRPLPALKPHDVGAWCRSKNPRSPGSCGHRQSAPRWRL